MTEIKIIHTELKGTLSQKFDLIKTMLEINDDADVLRFLIQYYFKKEFELSDVEARKEVEKDGSSIEIFMKKYGEEWEKLGE